jgi:hypothetical protein
LLAFRIYQRIQYGPIGRDGHWVHVLQRVGDLIAVNEIDAVAQAKRLGYVAPIVEPTS